ncbi:hypothetical protein HDV00_004886 [Rhizophlyctis rosea]|nr:hypothetical protein HDV00_004886 [Rhizophlyctis rosea]
MTPHTLLNRICGPLALVLWSCSEIGDVILFYIRYKIVKASPLEPLFRVFFYGALSCAVILRLADIGAAIKVGETHSTEPGVRPIEPTYFVFLLMIEVVLQTRYVLDVTRLKTVNGKGLFWTLLRSAGARFSFITIPLLVRIAFQYSTFNIETPAMQWIWTFTSAVNLFTMFDLLMLKHELSINAQGKSDEDSKARRPSEQTGQLLGGSLPPLILSQNNESILLSPVASAEDSGSMARAYGARQYLGGTSESMDVQVGSLGAVGPMGSHWAMGNGYPRPDLQVYAQHVIAFPPSSRGTNWHSDTPTS